MKVGFVGSEAKKFTPETEDAARAIIVTLIRTLGATTVVSGACHLGGIDIWAVEEAKKLGLETIEHKPKVLAWEQGYKPRNIKIAQDSDIVYCITLKELPPTYKGMKFATCYHCKTNEHVKSGGCWTVKYAKSIGKEGHVIVIQ